MKGYTIVELIVAVSILVFVTALVVSRNRDFRSSKELEGVAQTFAADLRLAQSQAASGRKDQACTGDLEGYDVEIVRAASPAEYEVRLRCPNVILVKEVELTGVSVLSPTLVTFLPLASGVETLSGSAETITFIDELSGRESTVTITPSGNIQ